MATVSKMFPNLLFKKKYGEAPALDIAVWFKKVRHENVVEKSEDEKF